MYVWVLFQIKYFIHVTFSLLFCILLILLYGISFNVLKPEREEENFI